MAILTALQSLLTGLQQIECHESLKELLVNNIMTTLYCGFIHIYVISKHYSEAVPDSL